MDHNLNHTGRHRKIAAQSGFTLTELLTALTVMGVLMAVAVPGMQSVVANNRRVTMTNEMAYAMRIARSEAIARNIQVTVCPSTEGLSCDGDDWGDGWIVFTDPAQDRTFDGADVLLLAAEGVDAIDVYPATFDDSFTYRPNGRVMVGNDISVNSGQLTICDHRGADHARVLIVDMSGRPRLSEHQSDGSDPSCSAST